MATIKKTEENKDNQLKETEEINKEIPLKMEHKKKENLVPSFDLSFYSGYEEDHE